MTSARRREAPKRRIGIRGALVNLGFGAGTLLLLLLAVLQGIHLVRGSLEVPDPLVAHLRQELNKQGWQADYRSLSLCFPASITVTQPRLKRTGEEEPVVEADYARIDFSFSRLIRGELWIKGASLYGGTVFCPAPHSPTGLREKVLEATSVSGRQKGETWEIASLTARINNLSVTASGTIPRFTAPPEPEEEEVAEPIDWESLLATLLPRIIRERPNFARAGNPQVQFHLLPWGEEGLTIAVESWADSVEAPHDVRIDRLYLAGSYRFDGTSWQGETATFQAAEASWNGRVPVTAHDISGTLEWAPILAGDNLLPDLGHLAVAELRTPAGSITGLQAEAALAQLERIDFRFGVLFQNEPLEGWGHLHWRTGDGQLDLISRLNPTPFMQHEIARELGLRRDIGFGESPFARATAWLDGWQLVRAAGHAHARQANIDGVFLDQASAHAELLPEHFVVPEMVLDYGDFQALGSYEVAFADLSYRLRFKGEARPLHIQGWFNDWWGKLWNEFEFPNAPLKGDLDIQSRHHHSNEIKLVGSVHATNFRLRGVEFDSFDSQLMVWHDQVDLFHIDLERPEGTAEGWFRYQPDPDTGAFGQLDFEAHSNVDPVEVAQIFGDAGRGVVSSFHFTAPPSLLLRGSVHGAPRQNESRVTITGEADAPLTYNGLALDRLMIDALLEGNDFSLRQIDAGLAGGEVTGDARKWLEGDEEKLEFSLVMRGLDTTRSMEALSAWRAHGGLEETASPNSLAVGGLADATIQAVGNFGDFHSFLGEGNVKLSGAELGEIHLLGILSRLLNVTPLGFTSLQFTEAEARFLINLQKLEVSGVSLTGPSSEIRASGIYLMDEDALDFAARLYFMKESRIPLLSLLLTPIMQPLAHIMEIRLTGSPSDPQWRFFLGPRNILNEITSEAPPKSPLEE